MVRLLLSFCMSLIALVAPAMGQPIYSGTLEEADDPKGSVYRSYGHATFIRGGVNFADLRDDRNVTSLHGSIGGRVEAIRSGRLGVSVEGELFAIRNNVDAFDVNGQLLTDYQQWAFAALVGLRLDYAVTKNISPFASFGVGPAYADQVGQIATEENLILLDQIDDSIQVGYGGRTGVEIYVAEGLSIEAAYRYFGMTTNPTTGLHSAEIGIATRF